MKSQIRVPPSARAKMTEHATESAIQNLLVHAKKDGLVLTVEMKLIHVL
jgi:hypothetical protein